MTQWGRRRPLNGLPHNNKSGPASARSALPHPVAGLGAQKPVLLCSKRPQHAHPCWRWQRGCRRGSSSCTRCTAPPPPSQTCACRPWRCLQGRGLARKSCGPAMPAEERPGWPQHSRAEPGCSRVQTYWTRCNARHAAPDWLAGGPQAVSNATQRPASQILTPPRTLRCTTKPHSVHSAGMPPYGAHTGHTAGTTAWYNAANVRHGSLARAHLRGCRSASGRCRASPGHPRAAQHPPAPSCRSPSCNCSVGGASRQGRQHAPQGQRQRPGTRFPYRAHAGGAGWCPVPCRPRQQASKPCPFRVRNLSARGERGRARVQPPLVPAHSTPTEACLPSSSRHAPHDRVYPLLPLLQHQPVAIRLVLDLARKAGAEVGCGDGHGGGESSRQWAHATAATSTA